ncbi:MAG: hypothetical protein HYZ72_20605 [Deltaproteobacteria bacterium]|nr:hypothetical protein [Deltaproteobacteria bacterium]
MTRSTLLYLGMLVLLGGGFEGIRRVGNTLTPPRHIAGTWHLTLPAAASPCPLLEFQGAVDASLQIEQSGRYLRLTFADAHHTQLHARFDDGVVRGSGLSTLPCATGTELHLAGRLTDDRLELALTRAQEAPGPAAPALSLIATRASSAEPHIPPTP